MSDFSRTFPKSTVDERYVAELAAFFEQFKGGDLALGPTDAGVIFVAMKYFEKLIRGGLIGPVIEV